MLRLTRNVQRNAYGLELKGFELSIRLFGRLKSERKVRTQDSNKKFNYKTSALNV